MVKDPVLYRCGDQLMLETYFYQNAKVPVAVLNQREGNHPPQQTIVYQEPSASGPRYEGQNISLFTKGDEARLERNSQTKAEGPATVAPLLRSLSLNGLVVKRSKTSLQLWL